MANIAICYDDVDIVYTVDSETLAADQTLRVSIGVDLTDLSPLTESTTEGS